MKLLVSVLMAATAVNATPRTCNTVSCTPVNCIPAVRYMRPDLENVPIERLIENLEEKIKEDKNNATLHMNLARVYGMAFAKKKDELEVNKRDPEIPWFSYEPMNIPFGEVVEGEDEEAKARAKVNLEKAIEHFEKAVELDEKNLTAKLGLAWSMDQLEENMKSIDIYREIVESGWEKEKDMTTAGLGFHSIVEEASRYLLPKLDEESDAKEIAALKDRVAKVQEIRRPITPIAIPLGEAVDYESVIDRIKSVAFDLDGSGVKRNWQWISNQSGWLVFDKTGKQRIESGLQLFGNVTFWCFWENGYQALASLDNNGDRQLSGDELSYLAIWQDTNSNGISEPGEVQSLDKHNIFSLSCDCREMNDSLMMFSPNGVVFNDGSTRPTFDVVLKETK